MAAAKNDVVLISFDVDGTLIHSVGDRSNQLHKRAFSHALREVFDVETTIDVVQHQGSTDPLILISVLEYHGIPKDKAFERLDELTAAMNAYFTAQVESAGQGLELLPGVAALLQALQAAGPAVATCLVTGNLEPIGWAKMGALGVRDYFTQPLFGGFGSDFCSGNVAESWKDRAELVRIAARRYKDLNGGAGPAAHFHVGDTPMDIKAALAAGAVAVGVTTGIFTSQQLHEAAGSEAATQLITMTDLTDGAAFMRAVGITAQ